MGFFGKGSLSRSEPNWLDFERRRLGLVAFETIEEAIGRRRKERENFKLERARLEREALEAQKRKEAGILDDHKPNSNDGPTLMDSKRLEAEAQLERNINGHVVSTKQTIEQDCKHQPAHSAQSLTKEHVEESSQSAIEPINQEHLQLSLDEAFYLCYSIGSLEVIDPASGKAIAKTSSLLKLFRQNSYFPPALGHNLKPDDPFLLSYVVYHHFRSLGWVVRDGIKFAADYLIYERGPVFTHAAFAIIIVPSYTDPYWSATAERVKYVEKKKAKKSWHWLHCINRVQNHVVKTLVLAYVDVPSPKDDQSPDADTDIGMLLRNYKVREFCVQRWSPNRNRD
jgi:tRNA-splicing endonuclease subunit Sen2